MTDFSPCHESCSSLPKLVELSFERLSKVRFIFTDVDDTLTWESALPLSTYQALNDLLEAGYIIIPVTGGCAGWSDLMARLWPISGVITEGGACFLEKESNGKLCYQYWTTAKEMQDRKERLLTQITPLLDKYPSLKLAQDQAYRLTDVAIDFAQDVSPPAIDEKDAMLKELLALGFNAKASSIHINICNGNYDKYSMVERLLLNRFHLNYEQMAEQVLYVGDAPNDESMFAKFPLSVGVANIAQHLHTMTHKPSCITEKPGGLGFAEIAERLLLATAQSPINKS